MKVSTTAMILTAFAVIVLDQVSKFVVVRMIGLHESIPLIPGWFDLVHVRNRGMAFGILNRPHDHTGVYLLTAVTIVTLIVLIFWFRKAAGENRKAGFGLSLIIGGAVGNLADRIRLREVVDFLDVHAGDVHWPAFNVADSAISVGTVVLALALLLEGSRKEE